MRRRKALLLAILLSLTAHTVFFAVSPHIILGGIRQFMDETRKMFRIKGVDKEEEKVALFEGRKDPVAHVQMSKNIAPAEYKFVSKMEVEAVSQKDVSLEKKKDEMNSQNLKDKDLPNIEDADVEDVLKVEEVVARKNADPGKRSLAEKLVSENLVSLGETRVDYDDRYPENDKGQDSGIKEGVSFPSSEEGADDEYISGSYGGPYADKYEDIGKYIDISLIKYLEPESGEKFFKLIIKVRDGVRLQQMPKEITFLIDSSKSMTDKKLNFVKKALIRMLKDHNEGDKFNLVAFRGDLIAFRKRPVGYSGKNVAEAVGFIGSLEAVGQTDVENALYGMVTEPMRMYPSYIMLVTDGRPTAGLTDSRLIIQEVTKENNTKRPVFCFAGGTRANRYLLDFISYQNRAWSEFVPSSLNMDKGFEKFYSEIKDPILVDVRYHLVGVKREEVYPKVLYDFYNGKALEIYGKFEKDKDFSMQILGRVENTTKEIIFKKSFAEASEGGPEVAREWAFRKIYFLISQDTMGLGDPVSLKREIEFLSGKYGIITPYDIQDGEPT